jgi:bifunctional non-homologous end joining protein LigD
MTSKRTKDVIPFRVSPMLATLVDQPFHRPGWIYEEKYDGIRILGYKEGHKVTLRSRNDKDRSSDFPDIVRAIGQLAGSTLLLDGEIVVFDRQNVSRFQLLQQGKGRPEYVVFDCLYAEGKDLREDSLSARRATLEKWVKKSTVLSLSSRLHDNGLKAFQIAKRRHFEGIVAKNLSSRYAEKRSTEWLKVKIHQEDEFVIGGFTQPTGSRKYFGALLLGVYDKGKLHYAGKVGTGFDEATLSALHGKLKPLIRETSPFADSIPEKTVTYVSPRLVAQASFAEWTKDGKLRHPVFLGLRDDKKAREVVRQEG